MAKAISIGHAGILKGLHTNILVLVHVNLVDGMMENAMKNNIVVHVMALGIIKQTPHFCHFHNVFC